MAKKTKAPYELSDEAIDKLISNLIVGIPGVESAKDGYKAHNTEHPNPEMQALGKYQFVPKYWWDEIKAFGKRNSFKVDSYQDFLNNPTLQDSYFRYYLKNDIIPLAQKAYSAGKNPAGLSLEEMAVLYHFQSPKVAEKAIFKGEFREATKEGVDGATVSNVGMKDYLTKYNKTLTENNIEAVPEVETMDNRSKERIARDYFNAIDTIMHFTDDLTESEKNRRIQELQSQYKEHVPVINEYIEQRNKENKEKAAEISSEKKEKLNKMLNYVDKFSHVFGQKDEKGKLKLGSGSLQLGGYKEAKEFEAFAKDLGIKVKDTGNFIYKMDPKDLIRQIGKEYQSLTGEKWSSGDNFTVDENGNWFTSMFDMFGEKNTPSYTIGVKSDVRNKINSASGFTEIPLLDASLIPDPPKPEVTETKTKEDKDSDKTKDAIIDADKPQQNEVEDPNQVDAYFDRMLKAHDITGKSMDKATYDKSQMKQELPFDAVTGLALGFIGNEQAKNAKIPLRTEHVSQAVENYTSELAKRSKAGLPVELEAAMANQLAEAFQGGLHSIVNASGGNRATVLGNQGTLEVAKNRGLIDIQLADYEAKEKAFQQYGQALQYINDFDARRDIANHGIKYQEAKTKQADGKALATAGFAQLTEALKYQRENGPGSANHMYKSALLTEMFGFNPLMKDDGSGTVEGTRSHWLKQKEEAEMNADETRAYSDKYNSLSDEGKKAADEAYKENPTREGLYKVIDSLSSTGSTQTSKDKQKGLIGASESLTGVINEPVGKGSVKDGKWVPGPDYEFGYGSETLTPLKQYDGTYSAKAAEENKKGLSSTIFKAPEDTATVAPGLAGSSQEAENLNKEYHSKRDAVWDDNSLSDSEKIDRIEDIDSEYFSNPVLRNYWNTTGKI